MAKGLEEEVKELSRRTDELEKMLSEVIDPLRGISKTQYFGI